jgi:ComF family protein
MRWPGVIQDLADFCFPTACAVCAAPAEAASTPLCETCLEKLRTIEAAAACEYCALPLPEPAAPCPRCLGEGVRPFGRILRLCNYAEPVRHLIHRLKFHNAWGLGEFLADRLCAKPSVRELLAACEAIVPVPLHPFRQISRGYNQAEVIARRLAQLTGKRLIHPAARVAQTDAQTDVQSKAQRVANLRRAFGLLDASSVTGRRIAVVDDVRTTAATLQAFGRCINAAKPASLDAIVVAAADPKHRDFEVI